MTWFKKAQFTPISQVKEILDRNNNLDTVKLELEKLPFDVCQVLSQLCNSGVVPSFYMTVLQTFCSENIIEKEPGIDQNQENSESPTIAP